MCDHHVCIIGDVVLAVSACFRGVLRAKKEKNDEATNEQISKKKHNTMFHSDLRPC